MGTAQILHVENQQGGTYVITAGEDTYQDDVKAWLWQADPPEGANLANDAVMLGYNRFILSGLTNEMMSSLNPSALDLLLSASYDSYRTDQEQAREDQQNRDELMNSPVPHMGGLTFGDALANWDGWQGLYPVEDGILVWLGFDHVLNSRVVQVYPGIEGSDEVGFNANVRWYIENQNMTLLQAARTELKERWNEMAAAVFLLGH